MYALLAALWLKPSAKNRTSFGFLCPILLPSSYKGGFKEEKEEDYGEQRSYPQEPTRSRGRNAHRQDLNSYAQRDSCGYG